MNSAAPALISIQRRKSDEEVGEQEWAMIEINGELLGPSSSVQVDNADGDMIRSTLFDTKTRLELGSITFPEKENPVMIIGTHELRGSIVKLTQPFVVLQKFVGAPLGDNNAATEHTPIDRTSTTTYDMVGVVRHKILFNQYPKTIMR